VKSASVIVLPRRLAVDVRVASRYGPHDLGLSADIAENYLKALDSELLGIAGS